MGEPEQPPAQQRFAPASGAHAQPDQTGQPRHGERPYLQGLEPGRGDKAETEGGEPGMSHQHAARAVR